MYHRRYIILATDSVVKFRTYNIFIVSYITFFIFVFIFIIIFISYWTEIQANSPRAGLDTIDV
jgi:preprotein translocase subunit SecY